VIAIKEMAGKLKSFCQVWDKLGLPVSNLENGYRLARVATETCLTSRLIKYSIPDGGYFVVVNMKKVKLPDSYVYPAHISSRPRDFKLAWILINELAVGAIPPSGTFLHP
jgi:kynurenine aminotransferase